MRFGDQDWGESKAWTNDMDMSKRLEEDKGTRETNSRIRNSQFRCEDSEIQFIFLTLSSTDNTELH